MAWEIKVTEAVAEQEVRSWLDALDVCPDDIERLDDMFVQIKSAVKYGIVEFDGEKAIQTLRKPAEGIASITFKPLTTGQVAKIRGIKDAQKMNSEALKSLTGLTDSVFDQIGNKDILISNCIGAFFLMQ